MKGNVRSAKWLRSINSGVNHSFARAEKYKTWDKIDSKASPELIDLIHHFCRWMRDIY